MVSLENIKMWFKTNAMHPRKGATNNIVIALVIQGCDAQRMG